MTDEPDRYFADNIPEDWYVTTHSIERFGRSGRTSIRWTFLLHGPGFWATNAGYRWNSERAAIRAGLRDLVQVEKAT